MVRSGSSFGALASYYASHTPAKAIGWPSRRRMAPGSLKCRPQVVDPSLTLVEGVDGHDAAALGATRDRASHQRTTCSFST